MSSIHEALSRQGAATSKPRSWLQAAARWAGMLAFAACAVRVSYKLVGEVLRQIAAAASNALGSAGVL